MCVRAVWGCRFALKSEFGRPQCALALFSGGRFKSVVLDCGHIASIDFSTAQVHTHKTTFIQYTPYTLVYMYLCCMCEYLHNVCMHVHTSHTIRHTQRSTHVTCVHAHTCTNARARTHARTNTHKHTYKYLYK